MPIQSRSRVLRPFLALFLAVVALLPPVLARANAPVDLQALVQETQRVSQDPRELVFVWWLPVQFWRASMESEPGLASEQIDEMLGYLGRYTIVAVADGRIGSFGGVSYRSFEDVRSSVSVSSNSGEKFSAVDDSTIDPDTRNMLQMLKPVLVNMMGPLGENMHFLVFPAADEEGVPIADPTSIGQFGIDVEGKEFSFRLPLGSLLPPRRDPDTDERFPGNYQFNPFTGRKLE